MGKIFITGDKHGEEGVESDILSGGGFQDAAPESGDVLVVLGDFGLFWNVPRTWKEEACLGRLSSCPWTTLVVDGNHENFDLLDGLPTEAMYGAPVGVMTPNVYHLRRGYVYDIFGSRCFVFGGGTSPDKNSRTPGKSWWYRENPSREETERGFDSLETCGWKVDHVFSHVAPTRALERISGHYAFSHSGREALFRDSTSEYLDVLAERTMFRTWSFGHYHMETRPFRLGRNGVFRCLYRNTELLEDEEERNRHLKNDEPERSSPRAEETVFHEV